jgi:hypothetical protein
MGEWQTTGLKAGGMAYRFNLSETGKTLEVEQWDSGKRQVDGVKRTPQWVKVFGRVI